MNFLNLKYFLVAAEELNFTKAAKRLYISQQSLSNHISKLEEDFKTSLFDRTPPLTLTNAGSCLVKHANTIMSIKEQACKEISDIRDFKTGEITIGVTLSRGSILLPLILPTYKENFPNIKIHLFQGSSESLETALYQGLVDIIIGFTPVDNCRIINEFLCKEEFLLLVPNKILKENFPSNHGEILEKLRQNPDIAILKDCSFITMNKNTRVGAVFNSLFKEKNVTPNIYLEVANIETMVSLCLEELGVIICPKIFIKKPIYSYSNQKIQNVHTFTLNYNNTPMDISLSYLKNKYLTQSAKEFIKIAKQAMLK